MTAAIGVWPRCNDAEKLKNWLEHDKRMSRDLVPLVWKCWDYYRSRTTGRICEHPFDAALLEDFWYVVPWDQLPFNPSALLEDAFDGDPPLDPETEFDDVVFESILNSGYRDLRAWPVMLSAVLAERPRCEWYVELCYLDDTTKTVAERLVGEFPLARDMRAGIREAAAESGDGSVLQLYLTGPQTASALGHIMGRHIEYLAKAIWSAALAAAGRNPVRSYGPDEAISYEERSRMMSFADLLEPRQQETADPQRLASLELLTVYREICHTVIDPPSFSEELGRRLRNAIEVFSLVSRQPSDGLRVMMSMSAIEMLLVRKGEMIADMLSQRIATLLVPPGEGRVRAVSIIKRLYNARSDFVHGREPVTKDLGPLVVQAERLAATVILAVALWIGRRADSDSQHLQSEDPKGKDSSETILFDSLMTALYSGKRLEGPPDFLADCLLKQRLPK